LSSSRRVDSNDLEIVVCGNCCVLTFKSDQVDTTWIGSDLFGFIAWRTTWIGSDLFGFIAWRQGLTECANRDANLVH